MMRNNDNTILHAKSSWHTSMYCRLGMYAQHITRLALPESVR